MSRSAGARDLRKVIEKALWILRDEPRYGRLKRDVRLRTELRIARERTELLAPGAQWGAMIEVLRASPGILRHRWGRFAVAAQARSVIAGSDNPVATADALDDELCELEGSARVPRYLSRLTRAAVWSEAAFALSIRSSVDSRAAGLAALRAISHNPMKLRIRGLPRMAVHAWAAAATAPRSRET